MINLWTMDITIHRWLDAVCDIGCHCCRCSELSITMASLTWVTWHTIQYIFKTIGPWFNLLILLFFIVTTDKDMSSKFNHKGAQSSFFGLTLTLHWHTEGSIRKNYINTMSNAVYRHTDLFILVILVVILGVLLSSPGRTHFETFIKIDKNG